MSLMKALDECRRSYCLAALQKSGGNVTQAARELGIGRQTLHTLIRRYNLQERRRHVANWGDLTH